ncbi:site-specific integrase [Brotonthovivens ammoniilytica]|uniref:Site-specific integrase n=1 Tax=Brotonthovivens ammoniilytica TaxID=2981725 RepID=A0ABT2TJH3_9FIRM|nr:site-specific integrase [Brotonthovivens ammoniilytica]MCU6762368.1 site-specific integrase [Brotonthovivens ammoniilytica]
MRPKLYVPSEKEIQRLMDYVNNTEMEIPILLAAFAPMRRGEIAALDSDHIQGNIVHAEYSMALNENNNWIKKSPKSLSGNRYIEFPDFVIEKLKGINGQITLLRQTQISDRFIDIIKRSGLPKFRFHDLRHYSASIQHALGIPDAYIMQRGGWGSDAVLKNVYRHVLEDKAEQMNQIANGYFESLCNTKYNTKKTKPLKIQGFYYADNRT